MPDIAPEAPITMPASSVLTAYWSAAPATAETPLKPKKRSGPSRRAAPDPGGGRAVRTIPHQSFRSRLLAYGGPILVINGSFDFVFRIGAGRFLRDVPGVTNRMIPRAGHLSNVDAPDAFTSLIEEFIETLPE